MASIPEEKLNIQEYLDRFQQVMKFVDEYFPFGFKKSENASSTSRTFFESIALGTYFAIKENNGVDGLDTDNISSWFNSEDYRNVVTSDAANNKSKLMARINFVKNKLLGQA